MGIRIEDLDNNLKVNNSIDEKDIVWLDIRKDPFRIHGIFFDEDKRMYMRMPYKAAKSVSDGVKWLSMNTAGGRVRFKTNSSYIAVNVKAGGEAVMPHMALSGSGGCDLYFKNRIVEKSTFAASFVPEIRNSSSFCGSYRTIDSEMCDYTINFPLYQSIEEFSIALKKDAVLEEADPYEPIPPVVYYGSSITQGGCASLPGHAYQAIISRNTNTDYINLGFSGSCRAEDQMAEYLSGLEMSVFVYDYDHNAPDAEYLLKTHLPLYRKIREKQPDLPIIIMSAPNTMPWYDWVKPRRNVVYNTYRTALGEGDKNVCFIDGCELFGTEDRDLCTVDSCHPTSLGFYRMAMRIQEELKKIPSFADRITFR